MERKRRRRRKKGSFYGEEEGGVILEHLSRLPFPPFLYRAAIKPLVLAATSFLRRSEQTEARETHGEVENGAESGGNRPNHRLSVCPSRGGGFGASHASCPGIGEDKASPGREKSSAGSCGSGAEFGVGKEDLQPKSFPCSGADKASAGGSWEVLKPALGWIQPR